ncbi:MAG: DUF432 domain-containing protein [Opitutales bacterium]
MSTTRTPWGSVQFSAQNEVRLDWERLRILVIKRGSDLLIIEERDQTEASQLEANPEAEFRRYAFQSSVDAIQVRPCMPDRPIVVHPLHPLRLAPKANVDFYVSIPVDILLSTGDQEKGHDLERIRSEILSDTWFGDQMTGVLCYATKSRARRDCPAMADAQSARAICKVQIQNKSTEQLHCTKFCLRLNHCHLWLCENSLWTSPVNVRYNGSDQLSAIDYSEKAPVEASGAVKIAEAEEAPLSGLIRRTFASLSTALA